MECDPRDSGACKCSIGEAYLLAARCQVQTPMRYALPSSNADEVRSGDHIRQVVGNQSLTMPSFAAILLALIFFDRSAWDSQL